MQLLKIFIYLALGKISDFFYAVDEEEDDEDEDEERENEEQKSENDLDEDKNNKSENVLQGIYVEAL